MPQPKSSSGRKRAPSKPTTSAAVDPTGLLDVLAKGIVLTADRIQETMDDAVRRGRLTRDDAEDLARLLIETGRKQTEELLHDVEELVGKSRGVAEGARRKAGGRLLREGDRARRVAGIGSFPISRYDDLTAAQITGRLTELTAAELRKVRDYERRHGNRKSVLGAIERKLA